MNSKLASRARVVLDTLLPSQAHPFLPRGLFDAGFDAFYEDFARTANAGLRWGFRLALFTALWIAPLLIRRMPPLTLHAREMRERALATLGRSRSYRLRQMLVILKTVAALGYGANRDVRDAIGYPLQHDDPRRGPQEARHT